MNESLIKYLAGLLDADGSLSYSFTRDHKNPDLFTVGLRMHLGACDGIDNHGFVASLPVLTGIGRTFRTTSYRGLAGYTNWQIAHRAELEVFLPRVIKHMVIKARHWHWMLGRWRELRSAEYGAKAVTSETREEMSGEARQSRGARVGPLAAKNHPSWAWVAGYLDGDGWYMHRAPSKGRYAMRVGAAAYITDVSALELLQKAFGGVISYHGQSQNIKQWVRSLSNAERSFALRFLPRVARHSRLKRHRIDQLIHHHQQRLSGPGATAQATV